MITSLAESEDLRFAQSRLFDLKGDGTYDNLLGLDVLSQQKYQTVYNQQQTKAKLITFTFSY